ncbi:MAG: glycosyltransferase family 39 protein [Anaerolineae bacterium]|nr:glycosyltransferase family 39 protein [Anaerolineae bacterium]
MIASTGIRVLFLLGFGCTFAAMLRGWLKSAPESSSAAPQDLLEAVFLALVGAVILTGWTGVVWASLGRFSLTALVLTLFPAAGLVWWLSRRASRSQPDKRGFFKRDLPLLKQIAPDWTVWALGVLLAGCVVVYFRPHEYVLGGSDAGTYVNLSATLAQTGDYVVHDDWLAVLAEHAEVSLREQPEGWLTRRLQFVGWYIDDHDSTRLVPQFYLFHPVLLAIGTSLGGIQGGLLVTPVWGVLGIAAIYLLTRRLFDAPTALLAAALFAVTPPQIWFSRYPTTEPLTLLLLFSGLLAFQVLWDEADAGRCWGLFGGAAFGAAFLTRIDLPVIWLLLVGFLVIRWLWGRWNAGFTAFSVTLGVFSVHTALSGVLISWPYVWNTYRGVFDFLRMGLPWILLPVVMGGLGVVLAGLWLFRRRERLGTWEILPPSKMRLLRWAVMAIILVLSGYAYFLRPRLTPIMYFSSWPAGVRFPVLDGQNWLRVGWYITPLGILLATLGVCLLFYRESLYRLGTFLSVGVLTTLQYGYRMFNTPYHIYTMRRYVPVVLPMLMIYAAVLLMAIWRFRRRWIFPVLSLCLTGSLFGGLVYQSRFVLPHRDFRGLAAQLALLENEFAPDAIIIMPERPQSIFSDYFGVPLRFTFGRRVLTLRQNDASQVAAAVQSTLAYATRHDLPVQLLAAEPLPEAVRRTVVLEPREMVTLTSTVLESTFFSYPSHIQPLYFGLDIYDVAGLAPDVDVVLPAKVDIDIGALDTGFVLDGFHDKERTADGATMRWTSEIGTLLFPLAPGSVTVEITAMGVRPPGIEIPEVAVYLDDVWIGQFTPVSERWQTYILDGVAVSDEGLARLQLETVTFNPVEANMSADDRDLGVLLDRIRILPRE